MKILVMGGNRFIGLHLVNALLAKKFHVTVLNRGSRKGMHHGRAEELFCDRDDGPAFARAVEGRHFDAVFDNCAYHPGQVEKAVSLLQGKVKHYIFLSTVAVYDKDSDAPYTESSPANGKNVFEDYAVGKARCEKLLLKASGFPFTIIRPTYVYGPDDYSGRMDKLINEVKAGKTVRIPKSNPKAQFVHVDDLASAMLSCIGNDKAIDQAFNICGEEVINYGELVELVGELVSVPAKASFSLIHDFPFMDWNMHCDVSKSKRILKVNYRRLSEGLKDYINIY